MDRGGALEQEARLVRVGADLGRAAPTGRGTRPARPARPTPRTRRRRPATWRGWWASSSPPRSRQSQSMPSSTTRSRRNAYASSRVRDQRPPDVAVATDQRVGPVLELGDDHAAVPGAGPDPGVTGLDTTTTDRPRRRQPGGGGHPAVPGADHHHVGAAGGGSVDGVAGVPTRGRRPSCHKRTLAVTGGERRGHAGHVTHALHRREPRTAAESSAGDTRDDEFLAVVHRGHPAPILSAACSTTSTSSSSRRSSTTAACRTPSSPTGGGPVGGRGASTGAAPGRHRRHPDRRRHRPDDPRVPAHGHGRHPRRGRRPGRRRRHRRARPRSTTW